MQHLSLTRGRIKFARTDFIILVAARTSEIYFARREAWDCKCKYAFCLSDERSLIKKIVRAGWRRPRAPRRKWSCGIRESDAWERAISQTWPELCGCSCRRKTKKRAAISGQNFSSAAFSSPLLLISTALADDTQPLTLEKITRSHLLLPREMRAVSIEWMLQN